jgi:hypothetical protein
MLRCQTANLHRAGTRANSRQGASRMVAVADLSATATRSARPAWPGDCQLRFVDSARAPNQGWATEQWIQMHSQTVILEKNAAWTFQEVEGGDHRYQATTSLRQAAQERGYGSSIDSRSQPVTKVSLSQPAHAGSHSLAAALAARARCMPRRRAGRPAGHSPGRP